MISTNKSLKYYISVIILALTCFIIKPYGIPLIKKSEYKKQFSIVAYVFKKVSITIKKITINTKKIFEKITNKKLDKTPIRKKNPQRDKDFAERVNYLLNLKGKK